MLHLHSDIHVSFRDFYSIGYLPILSEKVPGVVIFLHRFLAFLARLHLLNTCLDTSLNLSFQSLLFKCECRHAIRFHSFISLLSAAFLGGSRLPCSSLHTSQSKAV